MCTKIGIILIFYFFITDVKSVHSDHGHHGVSVFIYLLTSEYFSLDVSSLGPAQQDLIIKGQLYKILLCPDSLP